MSKKLFKAELKASILSQVDQSARTFLKSMRKSAGKSVETNLRYHPSRLSPVDYLVFKVLHGQFGESPYPVLPAAIGMVRRTLMQTKRFLSHGSL